MDFPPIWWLMPYGFVPDPIRYWVLDNARAGSADTAPDEEVW